MKFTGEYLDPTGLYHLRARQYDPATGRLQRPDPIASHVHSPLIASYVYAANRPTVMVDPSGEILRRVADGQVIAHVPTSIVDWESSADRCLSLACGARRPPRLVYPIPKRFPSRLVTFPSDPTYGFHNTENLAGYPAIDFAAARWTPVVAVENGRVREFSSAIGGGALYFRGDSGVDYFYAHIRSHGVSRGERVRAGEVIAVLAPLSNLDHLHLGANANFGGKLVGRGRAGTDSLSDRATRRAREIMRAVTRAPRV
jgi:RHS repeat-associated protein